MKALLSLALLLTATVPVAPVASAAPCVMVDADDWPPVTFGDCTEAQANGGDGKLVFAGDVADLCVSVEPSAFPNVVEVYECDTGTLVIPP